VDVVSGLLVPAYPFPWIQVLTLVLSFPNASKNTIIKWKEWICCLIGQYIHAILRAVMRCALLWSMPVKAIDEKEFNYLKSDAWMNAHCVLH